MRSLLALMAALAAPAAAQERLLAAPPPGWTIAAVAPDPEGGSLAVLEPGNGDGASGRLIVRSLDRTEGARAYLDGLAGRLEAACPGGTALPFGGATGALHLTTCDDPRAVTLSRAIRGERLHVLSRVWDAPPAEGEVRAWTRWMEAARVCGGRRAPPCPDPLDQAGTESPDGG